MQWALSDYVLLGLSEPLVCSGPCLALFMLGPSEHLVCSGHCLALFMLGLPEPLVCSGPCLALFMLVQWALPGFIYVRPI